MARLINAENDFNRSLSNMTSGMRNYTDHRVRDFETNLSHSFYTKRLVVEDDFTALNHANTSTRIRSNGNGDSADSRTPEVSLEIASHEVRAHRASDRNRGKKKWRRSSDMP